MRFVFLALCALALCARPGAAAGTGPIRNVTIVFTDELHVGFGGVGDDEGWDVAVINAYFHEHFPRAIRLARDSRERGPAERLVYTTHVRLHGGSRCS